MVCDAVFSSGLPSFEQVLTPRTTGFELAMAHIGHHFSAVYDLTICYEGFSQQPPTRSPSPNLFGESCRDGVAQVSIALLDQGSTLGSAVVSTFT